VLTTPFGEMGNTVFGGPTDGLFLDLYCPRMVLALKQEGLKIKLHNTLDGSGPFATRALLGRRKNL
jgi:hypothetical protein